MTQTELESLQPGTPVLVLGNHEAHVMRFSHLTKTRVKIGSLNLSRSARSLFGGQHDIQSADDAILGHVYLSRVATEEELKTYQRIRSTNGRVPRNTFAN